VRVGDQALFLAAIVAIVFVVIVVFVVADLLLADGVVVPHPPVPSARAMVGEWVHKGSSAKLDLFADGTLVATDVPKSLILDTDLAVGPHRRAWGDPISFIGSWEKPVDDGQGDPIMDFESDIGGGRSWINGSSTVTRHIVLRYGDDGEYEFTFSRVTGIPSPNPTLTPEAVPSVTG